MLIPAVLVVMLVVSPLVSYPSYVAGLPVTVHDARARGQAHQSGDNEDRPHQEIGQAIPDRSAHGQAGPQGSGRVEGIAVLSGLHHTYRHAA